MKTALRFFVLAAAVTAIASGCNGPTTPPSMGEIFTVDFNEGQPIRYRFVSKRDVSLTWGKMQGGASPGESFTDDSVESMEMVVAYSPIEVFPGGLTVIKATIESVSVKRTAPKSSRLRESNDAVKSLSGKSFNFSVTPNGKIEDYSEIEKVLKAAGEKAFRTRGGQGRIKDPDMTSDFFATQWFLWDAVSSIENPIQGVPVGQSWNSQLSLPTPMVMRKARDVVYTLSEVRDTGNARVAVIDGQYSLAESVPESWPGAYPPGRFQIAKKFGMLRRFKITEFSGSGQELYNIDSGRTEKYTQKYHMDVSAALMFPLPGADPKVKVDQVITMTLLKD